MKKSIFGATAAATTLLLATACGSASTSKSEGGGGKGPITIGYAVALTGDASAYDLPVFNGGQIAVKDINAAGGIDGRKLKIIKADTHSDLSQVSAAAQSVISRGANIIVSSLDYNFGSPAAKLAQSKGLLDVGGGGDPLAGKEGIGPLFFNVEASTNQEGTAMAQFAVDKKYTKGYFLEDTSLEYSKSVCSYAENVFTHDGGKVVGKDTFENSDPSVATQVTKLKSLSTKPDVVFLCSYLPGASGVVRQLRAAGVDTAIVGSGGADGSVIAGSVPKLSNYYYPGEGTVHGSSSVPAQNKLGTAYKNLVGNLNVQDYAPLMGYAEIQVIADALRKTGGKTTDGKTLASALETMGPLDLITGSTTYTSQCHTPQDYKGFQIYGINDGKFSTVADSLTLRYVPKAPC